MITIAETSSRRAPRAAAFAALGAALLLLSGCPPKAPVTRRPVVEPEGEQSGAHDATIELEESKLTGVYFEPSALAQPAMPGIEGKTTVKAQRKRFEKAKKPADKVEQGVFLAALLWPQQENRPEALKVLREIQGPDANEAAIFMLAVAEQAVGEPARAAGAWEELVKRFPDHKDKVVFLAYRASIALGAHDEALAAQLVGGADPTAADVPPELSYVAAWLRFRSGDTAGAWKAIVATSRKWRDPRSLAALRRDVTVMAARAGVPVAEAVAVLEEMAARDRTKMDEALNALSQAYHYAGAYELLSEVFERRTQGAPPEALAEIRNVQALVDLRMGRPEQAAERILAAWAEAQKAGEALSADARRAIVERILDLAMRFHSVYAKAFDERYGATARKLYDAYLTIPGRDDTAKVRDEYIPNLQATVADKATFNGQHTKDNVLQAVQLRHEELSACYEAALQASPKLAGTVKVMFDIAEDGKVAKVDLLEPAAAGPRGLEAVAGCAAKRIGAWVFSARKTPGITRVTYSMSFTPATP